MAVEKQNGEVTKAFDEVVNEFLGNFQKQLGTQETRAPFQPNCLQNGRKLMNEQQANLVRIPTKEETL